MTHSALLSPSQAHESFTYPIVTGKCPVPFNRLPNNFDSSVVFEALCVTAHHVKLLHSKSIGPLSSRTWLWSFWCTSGAMTSGRNVSQTYMQPHSQRSLLAIWNSRTASDERYRSLATRLRVSLLSSMIQLSPPSGWPRQSTDEAQTSLLHIQGGCLRRDSYTTKAPPPCNRSPLIFGVWAAGQPSRNVNLYFLYWQFILCSKDNSKFVSSFIWDKCHSSVMLCSCSSNSTFQDHSTPNLHRPRLHHN